MNKMLFAFISIAAIAEPFSASAAVLEKPEDALIRALEDEYHAAAFYDAVMSKFGTVCPFANIIESERAHSSMLVDVMKSYGMPIPKNT